MKKDYIFLSTAFVLLINAEDIISNNNIITKEGQSTILWCNFKDNREYVTSLFINTNKYSLSSLQNNLLYLSRIDKCVWKLPKGEGSCEVGPEKQICSAESTIRYNGNVRNCSIKIDRVQPDENGIWKVRQHLNELSRCKSIISKYDFSLQCIVKDTEGVEETSTVSLIIAREPNLEIDPLTQAIGESNTPIGTEPPYI